MKRIISKFGAYTTHIATLSEDSSVKPADHAKPKGYYNKWVQAKYILGCTLFVDILTPCTIFSKSDEIDILGAQISLLRTLKETEKLGSKPLNQWPIYAATLRKCTESEEYGSTDQSAPVY